MLFWDFHNFFVPFTNWTLIMTTLSLLLTINAARDTHHYSESTLKRRRALNAPCKYRTVCFLLATHHLIYTLSIVMNLIVMSVYWTILHKGQMAEYSRPEQWGKRLHERTVHSVPGTVCLLNLLVSNIRLKHGFWKAIVVVVVIYSLFLHHEYVMYGIIQYPFTDFRKGSQAWLNLFAIGVGAILSYSICVKLDNKYKSLVDRNGMQDYRLEATVAQSYSHQELVPTEDEEMGIAKSRDQDYRYQRCDAENEGES